MNSFPSEGRAAAASLPAGPLRSDRRWLSSNTNTTLSSRHSSPGPHPAGAKSCGFCLHNLVPPPSSFRHSCPPGLPPRPLSRPSILTPPAGGPRAAKLSAATGLLGAPRHVLPCDFACALTFLFMSREFQDSAQMLPLPHTVSGFLPVTQSFTPLPQH